MKDTVRAFIKKFTLKGNPNTQLSGLTFCAKDIFDVAGHITGCGNPDWAKTQTAAKIHAPVIEKLLAAGADLIGKTHTDEFAYSLMGVNEHYGTPINQISPDRIPGGSSSGSVAAVAAGLTDIGLGSDTGGSVRLPASFCGVWGIRTSHGLVTLDRSMKLAPSFDTVGWFTSNPRTMADVCQALKIDNNAPPLKKLLIPLDVWNCASAETVRELGRALDALQNTFGTLQAIILAPRGLQQWREIFRIHQAAEIWEKHGPWIRHNQPRLGSGVKERFKMASKITRNQYNFVKIQRKKIAAHIHEILGDDGIIIIPTSPEPAPKLSEDKSSQENFRSKALEMLCIAGHAGVPQLSVPAGLVDGGPVGISLIGPRLSDRHLISIAANAFNSL